MVALTVAAAVRWIGRLAIAILALATLTALCLQTTAARDLVRTWTVAWASRESGLLLAIGELNYRLSTPTFVADNVELRSDPNALVTPIGTGVDSVRVVAQRVTVELAWSDMLRGQLQPRRLSARGIEVTVRGRGRAATIGALTLALWSDQSRRWYGRVGTTGAAVVRVDAAGRPARLDGRFILDSSRLDITSLRFQIADLDADVRGQVTDLQSVTRRIALTGTTAGHLRDACALAAPDSAVCAALDTVAIQSHFTVNGPVEAPTVSLELSAHGVPVGRDALATIDAAMQIWQQRIELSRADAQMLGGGLTARNARIDLDTGVVAAELSWHDISARQVARAAGLREPVEAALSGDARVTGDPRIPASLVVDAQVRVASSTPAAVAVVTGHLENREWSTRVKARGPSLDVTGEFSGAFAGYAVSAWRTAPIRGVATVIAPDLRTALRTVQRLGLTNRVPEFDRLPSQGSADLTIGGTVGRPWLHGALSLTSDVAAGSPPIETHTDLTVAEDSVSVHTLSAVWGADSVTATGEWDRRRDVIDGYFSASVSDIAHAGRGFSDTWPVNGAATVQGRISGTSAQPRVDATVRASDVSVETAWEDEGDESGDTRTFNVGSVEAVVAVDERIDLHVAAPDLHLTATSVVGLSADLPFVVVAEIEDGDVGAAATALGTRPAVTGRVDATVVASRRHASGDLQAGVNVRRLDVTVGEIPVTLVRPAYARIEAMRLVQADVAARVGALTLEVSRQQAIDAWHVAAEGPLPLSVPGLAEPPTLVLDALADGTQITVRHATAWAGDTLASLTGHAPLSLVGEWLPRGWVTSSDAGAAEVNLSVQALPVGPLAALWRPGVASVVDGRFDVTMSASLPRLSVDALTASGAIENAWLSGANVTLTQEGRAHVAVENGRGLVDDLQWIGPSSSLAMRVESELSGHTGFHASATGEVDLGALLARAGERIAGAARFELTADAGPDGVVWSADAEVHDGAWVSREHGLALGDVEGRISCQSGRCAVDDLSARLNGGTVSIHGTMPVTGELSGGDLRLTVRGAGAELPRGTRHDIDADLELGGMPARLTGTITLWPGVVTDSILGVASAVSSLPRGQPETSSEERAGPSLLQTPLDVRIVTGSDLTFDSHDLQLAAKADVRVRGTLGAPQLRGAIAALEHGRIFVGGRMWDLDEGSVTLGAGTDGTETRIAATVTARISKYTVQMAVAGPLSQPTFTMTSDPPLGQSDLADLVLTGSVNGNTARAGGQQVATMVSGELLSSAGRTVGIDAVRIEQNQSELSTTDIEPVARLTISKRLSGRSEIIYSQGLSDTDDQAWILVYRPGWHSLDLRATIRTNGAEAYEFRQELELGASKARATATQRRIAPPVARVDIAGLPHDAENAVRSRLKLRPGERFTTAKWQRDRQAIAGYFHDRDRLAVRVRASHSVNDAGEYELAYRITPGPVTRIDVQGYQLSTTAIEKLREAWSRTVIEDLLAEDLTDVVRVELAKHHYVTAEVATTFRPIENEGRLAVITIAPGDRVRQTRIDFTGHDGIPKSALDDVVKQRRLTPRCWIEPSVLEAPVAALYRSRGYLDARAQARRHIEESAAIVTVAIDPGPRFTVGAVTFSGTSGFGDTRARTSLGLESGTPFTGEMTTAAVTRLRTAYARAGYLDAEIEARTVIARDRHAVDLSIAVKENQPSLLRDVAIVGRDETSDRLISNAFDVETGVPADPVTLDEGQQRLYRTGIFRTVDVDVRPVAVPSVAATQKEVEATVALEERAPYRVRYGLQFGPSTIDSITAATDTAEPGATFDLQRRNIMGLGIIGGVGGVWSQHQHRVRGTVSAATLRGRFVSSTFTIEQANQDREWNDGVLQVVDRSLRAIFEQRWRYGVTRRVEFAYGFDVDHRRLQLQASSEMLPLEAQLANVNLTLTYDSRDNRFNPRRGTFHTSRFEASPGAWLSNLAFTRYQVQHYGYWPFREATFASGVRFGTLSIDEQNNPASLLLFFKTGGSTSVRGYETDSLTPAYVIGVPVGGKVLLILNEELRVPVTKRIGVVPFLDVGNTFTGLNTLSLTDLKVGAGAGLRFDTPVAVLRLDMALPLPQQPGGPRYRWYLSIGQAF